MKEFIIRTEFDEIKVAYTSEDMTIEEYENIKLANDKIEQVRVVKPFAYGMYAENLSHAYLKYFDFVYMVEKFGVDNFPYDCRRDMERECLSNNLYTIFLIDTLNKVKTTLSADTVKQIATLVYTVVNFARIDAQDSYIRLMGACSNIKKDYDINKEDI